MPIHYYLPKLEGEKDIKPPTTGRWEKQDGGIFSAISNAIEVAERAEDLHVSSVPDIWARPLIFQSALRKNSQNPLRARFKQEWRGLLSLLALADYKYKNIVTVVPVTWDEGRFSKALSKLKPHREGIQLEKDTRYLWTDVFLIKFGEIPVGAFSPVTLVYTAVAYNQQLKNTNLDIKDDYGFLRPPLKGEDSYELIGEWLEVLLSKLDQSDDERRDGLLYTNEKNTHRDVTTNILELLKEWRNEIRGDFDGQEIDSEKVRVVDTPIITHSVLDRYQIYRALLCPLEKEDIGAYAAVGRSDFSLAMKRNYSEYDEVVIITENLLKKTNKRIWEPKDKGPIKLSDLNSSDARAALEKFFKPDEDGKGNEVKIHSGYKLADEKAVWIRPEKYFLTDILLKGKSGDLLVDSESEYNAGKTKYILPFKKEILNFFSWEDIGKLKPDYKEDGENVTFSFQLPIRGGDSETVKKLYKKKGPIVSEGSITDIDAPIVEIFPNYLDHHWRRYYLFHASAEDVSVAPVVFGKDKGSPRPVTESREHEDKELKQKIRITEISGDNAFPEGLEIKIDSDKKAGLVIIQHQLQLPDLSNKWKVGIDFGTSNTNIFRQSGTSDTAVKWRFEFPKYVRRICTSSDDIRKRVAQNYFVPLESIDLPVPTTLKIFNLARKSHMLLDYFAFFPSAYQLPHNVYSDIKWDVEGERKTEYFIESILFLILVEAVDQRISEIEFLCSYPKAFSPNNITMLKGEWENVFKKMLNESYRIIDKYEKKEDERDNPIIVNRDSQMKPAFETEGIAAGEFFGSEKTISDITERANKDIAAICLDIGGGTTDISIWYGGDIRFDASVTLAGRQIAQLFQKNGRLADFLFSRKAAIALDEKKNEPAFFAARLNLILRNEEKTIHDMLLKHANQKDIQWLRQIIALEFCAISFYTAMLTAAANDIIGENQLLDRIGQKAIGLHWGGNAAKLINWIDFGKYDRNGVGHKMLSAAYFNCLKDVGVKPNALSHFQSPWHKSEAAGGLVVMDMGKYISSRETSETNASDWHDMDAQKEKDRKLCADGIVCGEVIELSDGRRIAATDMITANDLFDNKNKTRFKLSFFSCIPPPGFQGHSPRCSILSSIF